jgi:hypothetical protein
VLRGGVSTYIYIEDTYSTVACAQMVLRYKLRKGANQFQTYTFKDSDQIPCVTGKIAVKVSPVEGRLWTFISSYETV